MSCSGQVEGDEGAITRKRVPFEFFKGQGIPRQIKGHLLRPATSNRRAKSVLMNSCSGLKFKHPKFCDDRTYFSLYQISGQRFPHALIENLNSG